jgi:hypothetical protein
MAEHTIAGFGYQGKVPVGRQRLVQEKHAVVDVRAVLYLRRRG